jgi:hypothetical protein
MNDELEKLWKEAVVALFKMTFLRICLEGLRKTTKNLRIACLRAEI